MDKSAQYPGDTSASNGGAVIDAPKSTMPQPAMDDAAQPEAEKHKKRTVGNKIYDWGIYGSIAWMGVAVLSVLSAHEGMHGNNKYFNWLRTLDKKTFNGLSNGLSKTILKGRSAETVAGWARGTTNFVTLGLGGWGLMAPLKWMEDNRERNAAHIDRLLGTTPPDPATIAAEPKQNWRSVLEGRLASWGLSYVAFVAMGPKLTGKISNWFGEKATHGFIKLKPAANPEIVRKWANIGAFDAIFTVITAVMTYGFSRYIAKKGNKEIDAEDQVFAINPTAPSVLEPQAEATKNFSQSIKPAAKIAPAPKGLYTEMVTADNGITGHTIH